MIRDQYTEPVTRQIAIGGSNVLELLDNIQITVWKLNEDGTRVATPANLYADRSSNAPFVSGNPFVTGANGKTGFFADPGEYEIAFHDLDTSPRIGDQSVWWSSTPGGPGALAKTQLPEYGRALNPAGTLLAFAGSVEPAGYLFCDGRKLDRNAESALFAAIDTAYNTGGEAGNEFRIPDYRGRSLVGINNMGPSGAATGTARIIANRGVAGGLTAVTLTTAQIPAHSHGVSDPGHSHYVQLSQGAPSGPGAGQPYGVDNGLANWFPRTEHIGTGISVNPNTGGGGSHENVQPYLASPIIIKT